MDMERYNIPHPEIHEMLVYPDVKRTARAVALDWASETIKYPSMPTTHATGDTMKPVAEELRALERAGKVKFDKIRGYHLDEYHLYPPTGQFSFVKFLHQEFFDPLGVKPENIFVINGLAPDPHIESKRYDDELGKVKMGLVMLGLGLNGHEGFTESCKMPLDDFLKIRTHYQILSPETVHRDQVERKQDTPGSAITQGPANLSEGDRAIMVFYGPGKGKVWGEAMYGPITSECPASTLRTHGYKVSVYMDEAAAYEVLKAKQKADQALRVQ